ncbi:thiol peroxidase [Microbulbifer sp. SAOS-129_SWC]|uniref:thiol peroxidase n=1 Tax=Microbulbifer sp. SAOS-129_SWC TaxID=3145235 RepID=UPI003217E4D0
MATVTLKGNPITTVGELPAVGSVAPDASVTMTDLSEKSIADFRGQRLVLNIFPSVDTPTCSTSVREFNQRAGGMDNVVVLNVSADLPFALARFCGAEGIENVLSGSCFRSDFGEQYGVTFDSGPLTGLLSRSVVVVDTDGKVLYREQVSETADEPDYAAALAAL